MIWQRLFLNLQQDFKVYLLVMAATTLLRIAFIFCLRRYLEPASGSMEVLQALYYGLRVSLKSAGAVTLACFVFATLPKLVFAKWPASRLRWMVGSSGIALISLLFQARIPYYEQFRISFNQFIFTGIYDDQAALLATMLEQYHLLERLAGAGLILLFFSFTLKKLLALPVWRPASAASFRRRWLRRGVFVFVMVLLTLFSRFSGSLTYAYDVSWENAGKTKDRFLNDAILDEFTALYRAYVLHERLRVSTGLAVDSGRMDEYGRLLAKRPLAGGLAADAFRKEARGALLPKPKRIFLIIGESYANWPLLPEYERLGIAEGLKSLIDRPDAAYVPAFLPNGMGTIAGINGIVTGFSEVNLYLNYQQQTYQAPYETSLAPQLKRLGYRTNFWYAGASSWERIRDFALAQGFDEFYASGDLAQSGTNVWGADDRDLYAAVEAGAKTEEPSLHVLMTLSNHPPFTADLTAEGFDAEKLQAALPPELSGNKQLLKELGHFWYADRLMTRFIKKMQERHPDSLFIVLGDHADRLNLEAQPGMYKQFGIPFVVLGQGVSKSIFPAKVSGSHMNVTPTLIELIAPPGFEYYAVGESLTQGNDFAYNIQMYMNHAAIGNLDTGESEVIAGQNPAEAPDIAEHQTEIDAGRAFSWWRIERGPSLRK